MRRSICSAVLAISFAAAILAPAFAGVAHIVEPARFVSLGALSPQATKYFTVALQSGTSEADAETVANYFRGFGSSATLSPDRATVFVRGTYGQAAAAGHTSFVRVQVRGQSFSHASPAPSFPSAIAAHILATTLEEGPSAVPAVHTTAQPGGNTPADIAAYYDLAPLYEAGLTGKGQNVAILGCASVDPRDITTFESEYGLPANLPTVVDVDGGTTATDLEPTGDVERVVATAPNANVYLYVTPSNCSFGELADGFAKIAADAQSKHFAAVSTSYGATEDEYTYYSAQQQLSVEHGSLAALLRGGTPVFVASGDWGATFGSSSQALYDGELTVWYPTSDNNVIAVGGTEAAAYSATDPVRYLESAWGDGGGGISTFFAIPAWQKTVPGIASTTNRNLPDVALASSGGEAYAAVWTPEGGSQGNYWFYGTSFAAPTWAGLFALVEQDRIAAKKKLLTAPIAALYAASSTTGAFTDIVQGCNGYYCAKPGYDNVTGLGVFDGYKLERALLAQP